MKKDMTLLIMAAGMGSRFGGLKQIEPVGPNGEFLIDYSIYDAIKAGFTKVIFIIKRENEKIFKETVGNRVSESIRVEYAYQDLWDLPKGYVVPEGREKPWGTAHAIMLAKDLIHEPFAVINADDFYGRNSYEVVADFLQQDHLQNEYAIIGYLVKNTLSENGSVKRAVCRTQQDQLVELIESQMEEIEGTVIATPLDGSPSFSVEKDSLVSMNMFGFYPSLFTFIENGFSEFLENNKSNMKAEYLIPDVTFAALKKKMAKVSVLSTVAKWQGITYKEDKDLVVTEIQRMIQNGEYPEKLW